jgi:hypothetical protein
MKTISNKMASDIIRSLEILSRNTGGASAKVMNAARVARLCISKLKKLKDVKHNR